MNRTLRHIRPLPCKVAAKKFLAAHNGDHNNTTIPVQLSVIYKRYGLKPIVRFYRMYPLYKETVGVKDILEPEDNTISGTDHIKIENGGLRIDFKMVLRDTRFVGYPTPVSIPIPDPGIEESTKKLIKRPKNQEMMKMIMRHMEDIQSGLSSVPRRLYLRLTGQADIKVTVTAYGEVAKGKRYENPQVIRSAVQGTVMDRETYDIMHKQGRSLTASMTSGLEMNLVSSRKQGREVVVMLGLRGDQKYEYFVSPNISTWVIGNDRAGEGSISLSKQVESKEKNAFLDINSNLSLPMAGWLDEKRKKLVIDSVAKMSINEQSTPGKPKIPGTKIIEAAGEMEFGK